MQDDEARDRAERFDAQKNQDSEYLGLRAEVTRLKAEVEALRSTGAVTAGELSEKESFAHHNGRAEGIKESGAYLVEEATRAFRERKDSIAQELRRVADCLEYRMSDARAAALRYARPNADGRLQTRQQDILASGV